MTTAATRPGLDVARLRADFPILAARVHGKPLVYLDNAATTQKPKEVIEIVREDSASKGEISGTIVVSAAGQVRRIPFRLDDARKSVGLVSIKTRSRLVPL